MSAIQGVRGLKNSPEQSSFYSTIKCGDKEIVMVRGCDIASLDVVSRVELLRLKRETAVWLDGLQRAAAEHGIGFMIGQGPSDNSWILRYALSRRMVEFVLQSLSESERDSPITAAMMNDESAAVYLSYWLSLLSEIDVTPVQLNPQSSNPDAA